MERIGPSEGSAPACHTWELQPSPPLPSAESRADTDPNLARPLPGCALSAWKFRPAADRPARSTDEPWGLRTRNLGHGPGRSVYESQLTLLYIACPTLLVKFQVYNCATTGSEVLNIS